MSLKLNYFLFSIFLLSCSSYGQDISLFQQFNGRYDFTFVGNTLNPEEDSFMVDPVIYTTSSATLSLAPNDVITKAYLYWAGCGPGDFEVKLNNQTILPQRIFSHHRIANNLELDYFSAFTDITTLVQATGNGTYTLSDLDLNEWIPYYFQNRTNFGGWAIIVVYQNNTLPLNQLNVYDGLQAVPDAINITLSSLNVVDNVNAKIGFLAWEGDENIAVNEALRINGNVLSNPPLNPANNAFNGTNSITNSADLHNMDLDVYDIQNNIQIGDTSANIQLTSGQDFVMINAIVTKLNSQLPDAKINIDTITTECNSREIKVNYTITNPESTAPLHAGVPIAIYYNSIFLQYTETLNEIAINGSESGFISLEIPSGIASPFQINFVVDDNGTGIGIIIEIYENNNSASQDVSLYESPELLPLPDLTTCNQGQSKGTFNFSSYETSVKQNVTDVVTFYPSLSDLQNGTNLISNTTNYTAIETPTTLYVKVDNENCYSTTTFKLLTKPCPPEVFNVISPNNDNSNDTFLIEGLRDVFPHFKLLLYNRWGTLLWSGNNNTPDWDGNANEGILLNHKPVPDGVYFYVLELNDPEYPKPLIGYLYLSR